MPFYLTALMILFGVEVIYLRIAGYCEAARVRPVGRSSHTSPTITGGGCIFAAAALAAVWMDPTRGMLLFGAGLSVAAAVSFVDDFRPLGVGVRLAAQLACAALTLCAVPALAGAPAWLWAAAATGSVACLNAFNFMDGINGITAAYSAVLLAALMFLDSVYGFADPRLPGLALCAVVAFGYFNFRRRAVCFAGDVGAISIAAVTLYLLASLIAATGSVWWLVLVAVYGVDTSLTIVRRIIRRENIFRAHRLHLYQYLANECRVPQLAVASAYAGVQLLIDLGAWLLRDHPAAYFAAVTAVLCAAYLILMRRRQPGSRSDRAI